VLDVKGLEEVELDPALASREGHGDSLVFPEAVVGEVELQRSGCTLSGLGGFRRALEVAVFLKQGLQGNGDGVLFGLAVDVVSDPPASMPEA